MVKRLISLYEFRLLYCLCNVENKVTKNKKRGIDKDNKESDREKVKIFFFTLISTKLKKIYYYLRFLSSLFFSNEV